mmetsp:Transcript_118196/g.294885  ORF Transcript_118196/g.294885 Transcript_118196/m.294885 type:complete len:353 (+) Transcript_118196:1214-2272(+)
MALRRVLGAPEPAASVSDAAKVRTSTSSLAARRPTILTPIQHSLSIGRRGEKVGLVDRGHASVPVLGAPPENTVALGSSRCIAEQAASVACAAEFLAETTLVASCLAIRSPIQHRASVPQALNLEGGAHGGDTRVPVFGAPLLDAGAFGRVARRAPLAASITHATLLLAVASTAAHLGAILAPIQNICRSNGDLEVRVGWHDASVAILGPPCKDAAAFRRLKALVPLATRIAQAAKLGAIPRLLVARRIAIQAPIRHICALWRFQRHHVHGVGWGNTRVPVLRPPLQDPLAFWGVERGAPTTTRVAHAAERLAISALVVACFPAIRRPIFHILRPLGNHLVDWIHGHHARVH